MQGTMLTIPVKTQSRQMSTLSASSNKGVDQETVLYTFATVPVAESVAPEAGVFMLVGEKEYNYSDGYYDDILAFLIIIAVLLLADWGVYCYEQYQLR